MAKAKKPKYGIVCQSCGIEAPARHVAFYQNIGALVVRFHKSVNGRLCKRCVHKHFWSMTGTTLAIGWLGHISLVIAPCFVINNLLTYLFSATMPKVPAGARVPVLTHELVARINPHADAIFAQLNAGRELNGLLTEMAPTVGVTPGELLAFLVAASTPEPSYAPEPPPPTYGFPVVMQQPAAVPPALPGR